MPHERISTPDARELSETVERMESRLGATPALASLWAAYGRLQQRFEVDLPDSRDQLMARSAVLMLLQDQQQHIDRFETLARRYLAAYAAKDLTTIAHLIADGVLLRDWNHECRGRDAFLAETQANFEAAHSLAIDIEQLHATPHSVVAELRITVNGSLQLRVVDVLDLDDAGRIRALRAYKGLDPAPASP